MLCLADSCWLFSTSLKIPIGSKHKTRKGSYCTYFGSRNSGREDALCSRKWCQPHSVSTTGQMFSQTHNMHNALHFMCCVVIDTSYHVEALHFLSD